MPHLRKLLKKRRITVGLQLALAMMLPPKSKGGTNGNSNRAPGESRDKFETQSAPPGLTGRWDFSRLFQVEAKPEIVEDATKSAREVKDRTRDAWRMTVKAAEANGDDQADADKFVPKPMSHEEVRLWLQCFNAGPYATLRYKGDVPYRETRNYVPRVLKYYEQDLSDNKYDDLIIAAAEKYGHDPQLIRAVMKTESSFRNDTVSHAGARGLMQVMPIVWKDIKKKYKMDWEYSTGVFDPEKNIEVACAYLAWLRYDFLPRHFAAFDPDPEAPTILVRDRDRGVPDRKSPRIVAKSDTTSRAAIELAMAENKARPEDDTTVEKDVADSESESKQPEKAEKSDAKDSDSKTASKSSKSDNKKSHSSVTTTRDGKKKVVMRGGTGKSISITFSDNKIVADRKKSPAAGGSRGGDDTTQGG